MGGAGRYPIGTTIITNNGNTRLDWANRTYAEAGSALHQTPLHQIRGNLSKNNRNYNDVDLFEIWIEDPSVFKAYTKQTNNETRVANPQLFLFDGDGHGVYASDNAPFNSGLHLSQAIIDASVVDTLTNPDLFGSLTSGLYLLGISRHDVHPRYKDGNNNRRIFNPNNRYNMFVRSQADPNGDGIADHVVSKWTGGVSIIPDNRPYRINLEGAYFAAVVPEPSVMFLLGAGLVVIGTIRRRKSDTQTAV